MNRKHIALLTGLTLLTGSLSNNVEWLRNSITQNVTAAQTVTNLKSNQKYPDISKKLDLISMEQYTSDNLFMNVTLKKFYIKDSAIDSAGNCHLLLVPVKSSNQYFLLITKSNRTLKNNRLITVQGFLNGKNKINNTQIMAGLSKKYLNKTAVSITADKIAIY
ncbi:hypothetical protein [Companilactobacillus kimchiensis]|uniref:Uncharacterized protein n=1 Tax=Companilactobacillus kimchiensis TaxID=993692 RepID=A0A0R2LF90_9LACO|nr:hypothetical protein [Companilactobacillus kimchiensis]KRN98678.1 hypothetical protein IV57_GL001098 [Companilactobacillus kimchiensis]